MLVSANALRKLRLALCSSRRACTLRLPLGVDLTNLRLKHHFLFCTPSSSSQTGQETLLAKQTPSRHQHAQTHTHSRAHDALGLPAWTQIRSSLGLRSQSVCAPLLDLQIITSTSERFWPSHLICRFIAGVLNKQQHQTHTQINRSSQSLVG